MHGHSLALVSRCRRRRRVWPLPARLRRCLRLVWPPPSWLRHCLRPVFPLPSPWLRQRPLPCGAGGGAGRHAVDADTGACRVHGQVSASPGGVTILSRIAQRDTCGEREETLPFLAGTLPLCQRWIPFRHLFRNASSLVCLMCLFTIPNKATRTNQPTLPKTDAFRCGAAASSTSRSTWSPTGPTRTCTSYSRR